MLTWIYNKSIYGDKEEKLDDVGLHLNVPTEKSADKLEEKIEKEEKKSYKEKLKMTSLTPLTTKLDIIAICEIAEALGGRKMIPEVKRKETRSQRIGILAASPIDKNDSRPTDIRNKLENFPTVKAIETFNTFRKEITDKYVRKNAFKNEMYKLASTYDTLNCNGIALDQLKLGNLIPSKQSGMQLN